MRILVLNAHPDFGSFCDHIADAYVVGATLSGHQVEAVALRDLRFDLVLRGGYAHAGPLEPDLIEQQRLLTWCEHLVVVSPNWWWSAPALLKGYIDRVFLPGFAMRYHARFPYVEPLLRGRSARVLYTQNAPRLAGVLFRGDLFWHWIKRAVLRHCGFSPVRRMVLYDARHASDHDRNRFLDDVRDLGRLGGTPRAERRLTRAYRRRAPREELSSRTRVIGSEVLSWCHSMTRSASAMRAVAGPIPASRPGSARRWARPTRW